MDPDPPGLDRARREHAVVSATAAVAGEGLVDAAEPSAPVLSRRRSKGSAAAPERGPIEIGPRVRP